MINIMEFIINLKQQYSRSQALYCILAMEDSKTSEITARLIKMAIVR